MVIHLLWATIILGIRAGLWIAGLVLGIVVALLPHVGRALYFICSEGVRIYSRHHLEMTGAQLFLQLAAFQLLLSLTVGGVCLWLGILPQGALSAVSGVVLWLCAIELTDIRHRHSTTAEDYLLPWK